MSDTVTIKTIFDWPQPHKGRVLEGCCKALLKMGYAEKDIVGRMRSAEDEARGQWPFKTVQAVIDAGEHYRLAHKYQDVLDQAIADGDLLVLLPETATDQG